MTLLRKTLLITVSTLACLLLASYTLGRFTLLKGFADLERKDIQQHVQRCRAALSQQIDMHDTVLPGWANSDETYVFVDDLNEAYIKSNLSASALLDTRINVVCFVNRFGKIVFEREIDLRARKEVAPLGELRRHLGPGSPLLRHPNPDGAVKGLILMSQGPMLVASRPILHTDRSGPVNGTLVMGCYLDRDRLAAMERILLRKLSILRWDRAGASNDLDTTQRTSANGQEFFVRTTSETELTCFVPTHDLYGNPSLLLRLDLPRAIQRQGLLTVRALLWCLLASGVVFGLITLRLLHRQVVARVAALDQIARDITYSGDLSQRVPVRGRDELADLTHSINTMLAALEDSEKDLRNAKSVAEEANRLKSRFLANVSHEIRTPLNCIIGFAEAILSSNDMATVHQQAQTILRESETLLVLINDLLDHAKIEAGRMELERRPMDLSNVLEGVLNAARVQAQAKSLDVCLELSPDVPRQVVGDALRLRQILMNLASNAVKFTERGSVTLRAAVAATDADTVTIRFSVSDTGIGISEEKQRTIFESFSQADISTARQFGGTGLGTTIARQLVTLMGGQIGVESTLGVGSTFWFVGSFDLPTDDAGENPRANPCADTASAVGPVERRKGRILLAEDYPSNRKVATLHLEAAGHSVTPVENGEEAVRACDQCTFDLILMDCQMPKMDGLEATRRIRSGSGLCARVPILAMTATVDPAVLEACTEAGMDDVLPKPIRRDALLSAVEEWLQLKNLVSDAPSTPPEVDSESASLAPIDLKTAIQEFGDEKVVWDVLGQFLINVESQIREMKEALTAGQTDIVRRQSHAIKGGASTLTAWPLAEQARELERSCATQPPPDLIPILDNLAREFDRLKEHTAAFSRISPSEQDGK